MSKKKQQKYVLSTYSDTVLFFFGVSCVFWRQNLGGVLGRGFGVKF